MFHKRTQVYIVNCIVQKNNSSILHNLRATRIKRGRIGQENVVKRSRKRSEKVKKN